MSDPSSADKAAAFDPTEVSRTMLDVAVRSQKLAARFFEQRAQAAGDEHPDPLNLADTFSKAMLRVMSDPVALGQAQLEFWRDSLSLWQNTYSRMLGLEAEPVAVPHEADRRFAHADWEDNAVFDFIKQSYLLASRYILSTFGASDGLDAKTAEKVEFFTRQFVDACAPTNFVLSNPEVLRATIETNGENLVNGLQNMLEDLERGQGQLRPKMTDTEAFELGVNVATTPGKVVYQNELMQLLQFLPQTEKVHRRPLLIVPPWINKYYIMDLRPKNSLIKWLVEQGHTVFVISWVNPDQELAEKSFDDYLLEGPVAALDAIRVATGEEKANAIGYCIGGTLLAAVLGYLAARGEQRIRCATFLTSMIDFAEPGELGVFIDEHQVANLEAQMEKKGYLDGAAMATTFNMLRANDLIWSFVINNYLLGKEPFPFDLLYWNADSTRMPRAMHSFYLRKMYMENLLREPGGLTLAGVPIDLSRVRTPAYFLSTKEDHIAPWPSTYAGAKLLAGPVRFVLAESGHIAGVINPPASNKYGHWTNGSKLPATAEQWLEQAEAHEGSWWPNWARWCRYHGGGRVAARQPGDGGLAVLEDAPGAYARVRLSAD